jgi:MFS family permease
MPLFSYLLMFPVASEKIRLDLSLSYTQVGTLIAVVYLLFAASGPPAGWLSDKWGAKYTAMVGLSAPVLTSVLFAESSSFYALLVAQFLAGIGLGFYWTGSIAMLSTWYPREALSRVVGLLNAGIGVGLLMLTVYAPRAMGLFGWRTTYLYLMVPLVLADLFFLLLAGSAVASANAPSELSGMPKTHANVRIGVFGLFLVLAIGFLGQGQWSTLVTLQVPYALSQHLTLAQAGIIGTIGMGAYILVTYAGGWVAEKTKKTILIVRWSFLLTLAAVPFGYMTSWASILTMFLVAVGPVMFGLPAYYGMIPRIAGPENVGRYTGLLATATAVGSIVYTQTNGVVLDAMRQPGYRLISWYAGLSGFLAFLLSFYPPIATIDD